MANNRALTPKAFGANINGVKRNFRDFLDERNHVYSADERNKYSGNISATEYMGDFAYRAKNSALKFTTKHKTLVRSTIAAVLLSTALLGANNYRQNLSEYNSLNVNTNIAQGYQVNVSNSTQTKLNDIRKAIESAEKSSSVPTNETLAEIREDLDNVIDDVMSDLVTKAFESKHPDCHVNSVETNYDKSVNNYIGNGPPNSENTCTIEYIDKKGNTQTEVVQNFTTSPLLTSNNPIVQSYDDEYSLDNSYPSDVISDTGKSFVEKDTDIMSLLGKYKEILENTEHLAGTQFTYSDGFLMIIDPHLTSKTPDRIVDKDGNVIKNNNEGKPAPTVNEKDIDDGR